MGSYQLLFMIMSGSDMMQSTIQLCREKKWLLWQPWGICSVMYGVVIILDHQNIGVAITFSASTCLVQEIWCKIQYSVMAESKTAAMAAMRHFCDGSISENVWHQTVQVYQILCLYEKVTLFFHKSHRLLGYFFCIAYQVNDWSISIF